MTQWEKYLRGLQVTYGLNMYTGIAFAGDKFQKITKDFQKRYPGKYTLDWKVNQKTDKEELYPFFENEKDQTWWLLKYS